VAEAIYFGLMTASAEESADEARKALHSTGQPGGVHGGGRAHPESLDGHRDRAFHGSRRRSRQATAKQLEQHGAPGSSRGSARIGGPLSQVARRRLRFSKPWPNCCGSRTAARSQLHVYNGRLYRLRLRRERPTRKAGEHFPLSRPGGRARSSLWTGVVQRVASGGKPIDFRLWVDESAAHPIPLRIEYQPKSYLTAGIRSGVVSFAKRVTPTPRLWDCPVFQEPRVPRVSADCCQGPIGICW
jgi:hypothetical protein